MGIVAVGRVATGTLRSGDEITFAPLLDGNVTVKSIEINRGFYPEEALPGDFIGVAVKNIPWNIYR